jgi:hypothetical protein
MHASAIKIPCMVHACMALITVISVSIPKVVGSIPIVVRHIFQACPVCMDIHSEKHHKHQEQNMLAGKKLIQIVINSFLTVSQTRLYFNTRWKVAPYTPYTPARQ